MWKYATPAMKEKRHLVVWAQTASGNIAAYFLPILSHIYLYRCDKEGHLGKWKVQVLQTITNFFGINTNKITGNTDV